MYNTSIFSKVAGSWPVPPRHVFHTRKSYQQTTKYLFDDFFPGWKLTALLLTIDVNVENYQAIGFWIPVDPK